MNALLLGRIATVSVFAMSLSMVGCSTAGKSVGLGAGIGGGSGMAIGAIADPGKNGEFRTRNVIIGGAVGAMAGMIAASAIHSSQEWWRHSESRLFRAQGPRHMPVV